MDLLPALDINNWEELVDLNIIKYEYRVLIQKSDTWDLDTTGTTGGKKSHEHLA